MLESEEVSGSARTHVFLTARTTQNVDQLHRRTGPSGCSRSTETLAMLVSRLRMYLREQTIQGGTGARDNMIIYLYAMLESAETRFHPIWRFTAGKDNPQRPQAGSPLRFDAGDKFLIASIPGRLRTCRGPKKRNSADDHQPRRHTPRQSGEFGAASQCGLGITRNHHPAAHIASHSHARNTSGLK